MQTNFLQNDEYPSFLHHINHGVISHEGISAFKLFITNFYNKNGRDFPWRQTADPYKILVSEVMLQQTQTYRAVDKFNQFIATFPTINSLANAPFSDVLRQWQGLGYNRRALYLQKIAQLVLNEYESIIPDSPEVLITFPGIGAATAASICAFAYNKPTVFIETNIRAVYIYSFFRGEANITDKQLFPIIEATLDIDSPRLWYYALMDYGVALKKTFPNPSRLSAHHTRQSSFEGSERQIRGMILRLLTAQKKISIADLCSQIDREPERVVRNLQNLCKDGLINKKQNVITLVD